MKNTTPNLPVGSAGKTLVQLRARITLNEHHALKVRAVTDRRDIADVVAEALRTAYAPLNPKGTDDR